METVSTSVQSESEEQKLASSYDEVPYKSYSYPYSHPDYLATTATIFGMRPKAIKSCRVLEIGCASGGNLIPMGYSLPQSEFLGIDLSKRQTDAGQQAIKDLGLANIEIRNLSVLDVDDKLGEFDYIIAHGVYSWVPTEVQEKILETCEKRLSENGVAYISYNTYPGWHFRGMIRDMMLYHTAQFEDPAVRVAQARYLLTFLSSSAPAKDDAYAIMLRNELNILSNQDDSYILHDHLEETNDPIYFSEFVDRAEKHGLQYLAEAEFGSMLPSNFPNEVFFTLRRIANDIVRMEQYMDFVRNRMFRQTLLCRQGIQLNRDLDPHNLINFFVASPAKPILESVEIESVKTASFGIRVGATLNPPHPLVKTAFEHLAKIYPQSVSFQDLLLVACSQATPDSLKDKSALDRDALTLATELLNAYKSKIVKFRIEKSSFVTDVSDKPTASAFARYEAKTSMKITNQLHTPVDVDPFIQKLVTLLDGKLDKQQILEQLIKQAEDGVLMAQDGQPFASRQDLAEKLGTTMEFALRSMSKSALLTS